MFTRWRCCELHPHVCNIIYLPISLPVMYKSPTMSSSPENCIKQNTDVTILCNSTGGHQKGLIWWFDEFGTNCTGSAELVAKKTDDTLFSLSSKLTVLKATCRWFHKLLMHSAQHQWSPGGEGIIWDPVCMFSRYVLPSWSVYTVSMNVCDVILFESWAKSKTCQSPLFAHPNPDHCKHFSLNLAYFY